MLERRNNVRQFHDCVDSLFLPVFGLLRNLSYFVTRLRPSRLEAVNHASIAGKALFLGIPQLVRGFFCDTARTKAFVGAS